MKFQLVDSKPIMEQVHEYENVVAEVLVEGMKMCLILQANVLIEKLPESWSDYWNHLKHKKRDLTLDELFSHMKIKEANCLKDKGKNQLAVKANLIEASSEIKKFKGNFGEKKGPNQSNDK